MHFDSFAEIWNKSDGFLSLLKLNDDSHDHEADQAQFEGTCYKLKSDIERFYTSQDTGTMLVAPQCTRIV